MPPPFEASQTFSFQVVDDAFERIRHGVEEAGDRQAARGAAVAEDRRRRHEPQPRHRVVEPLRVGDVVGVGAGDAREHVLIALARQQIAVGQRRLAEHRQQLVAAAIEREVGGFRRRRQRSRQRRRSWRARHARCAVRRRAVRRVMNEMTVPVEVEGVGRHRNPRRYVGAGAGGRVAGMPADEPPDASDLRGTPPEDVHVATAGLLARGSSPLSGLPGA